MDRELAGAVLRRWDQGLPVAETALYKAASVLGIDPQAALAEARFYTHLDSYLLEKRAMTRGERRLFSLAAGIDPRAMTKTASAYGFSQDELILEALRENDWVPKIAMMMAPPEAVAPPGAGAPPPPGAPPPASPEEAMAAPPDPAAAVQQAPEARFKPSPTAPDQAAPSAEGNLDALLAEHQGVFGGAQGAAGENGGLPAAGMPEPPPPPPAPEERIMQVAPQMDAETAQRYGEKLVEFEQSINMPISDPKQMVKFVKELQKVDSKRIDEGMKAYSEQLEQQQQAELGVGQPTVPGGGAPPQVPGGGGAGPGAQAGGAPKPGSQAGGPGGAPGPGSLAAKPKQPPQPQQPPPGDEAAVEKVASAARALARASFLR